MSKRTPTSTVRTVAIITVDGVNVNETLVKVGYAWVYRKYWKQDFCNDWLKLEEQAKNARIGLWSDPKPSWGWRKTSKQYPSSINSVGGIFHGNTSSKVFHAVGCKHFNYKNCSVSFTSVEEAEKSGYRPDNWCVH